MSKSKKRPDSTNAGADAPRIYRLKVTLRYTDPPVWRRVEVPAGIPIDGLATAMLVLFGWDGEHLSEIDIKGKKFSDESDWLEERPMWEEAHQMEKLLASRKLPPSERAKVLVDFMRSQSDEVKAATEQPRAVPTLSALVPRVRTRFTFTYDFGDDWKHLIEVEKIAPAESGVFYPRCMDGARAHPLEDCGGPWGFAELIAAAGNPNHPRFADLVEWGMKEWDPAKFPIEQINEKLAKCFARKK